jgi:hypothetical protein
VKLYISRNCFDVTIKVIRQWVPLVPVELTFNINESRFSECEELKPKSVLTPTEARASIL